MKKKTIYTVGLVAIFLFLMLNFTAKDDQREAFSDRVKIALRQVGNELLLSNGDSTSIILPVVEIDKRIYEISFQSKLAFIPGDLVAIAERNIKKSELPNEYRVSVLQCSDKEVAYSYEMAATEEKTIIPCIGRKLYSNCYVIKVKFLPNETVFFSRQTTGLLAAGAFLIFLFISFKGNDRSLNLKKDISDYTPLGNFKFYPEQNKLVKEAEEINLSKKECELLAIFVASPNQIIKREDLTKKVWEDNGVFVGRSLDTYISKLRKKLKDDQTLQITNVHGVGYKLEVN